MELTSAIIDADNVLFDYKYAMHRSTAAVIKILGGKLPSYQDDMEELTQEEILMAVPSKVRTHLGKDVMTAQFRTAATGLHDILDMIDPPPIIERSHTILDLAQCKGLKIYLAGSIPPIQEERYSFHYADEIYHTDRSKKMVTMVELGANLPKDTVYIGKFAPWIQLMQEAGHPTIAIVASKLEEALLKTAEVTPDLILQDLGDILEYIK